MSTIESVSLSRRSVTATLAGLCSFPLPSVLLADEKAGVQKHAILFGVSQYDHAGMNNPPLKYPEDDAQAIASVFEKAGFESHAFVGKACTSEFVREQLKKLESLGNTGGVVVIGFFGHGVQYQDDAYFAPFDAKLRVVRDANDRVLRNSDGSPIQEPSPDTLIAMREVLDALAVCGAGNKVLLVDCCRNNPSTARGRAFGAGLKKEGLPIGTAAIFACSEGERAFEDDAWRHGAFTKALLEILSEKRPDSTVNSMSFALSRRVKNMVADKTSQRQTQTVNPVINGVVDLAIQTEGLDVAETVDAESSVIINTNFSEVQSGLLPDDWLCKEETLSVQKKADGVHVLELELKGGRGAGTVKIPFPARRKVTGDFQFECRYRLRGYVGRTRIMEAVLLGPQNSKAFQISIVDQYPGYSVGQSPFDANAIVAGDFSLQISRKGSVISTAISDIPVKSTKLRQTEITGIELTLRTGDDSVGPEPPEIRSVYFEEIPQ